MKREEVKEILPLMEAYSKGKTTQVYNGDEWIDLQAPNFKNTPDAYRIKPEPKYRPFKNREECWQEMQKHQPFGWVKRIDTGNFEHIKSVRQETIEFIVTNAYLYEDAFRYYKFPDGTPFGIKED